MFAMLVSAESSLVSFVGTFDVSVVSGAQSLVMVDKLGRVLGFRNDL